jgi:hypothetical protein
MVYFQTQNPKLGERALDWKMSKYFVNLEYFTIIWYILCSLGTFFPVLVLCTKKNLATMVTLGWARFLAFFHKLSFTLMVGLELSDT